MGRVLVPTKRFTRAYRRLAARDQELVDQAIQSLRGYLDTGQAAAGLGITKLGPGVFEARAGLALRLVYVEEGSEAVLVLLGNHDEVRRFLRRQ